MAQPINDYSVYNIGFYIGTNTNITDSICIYWPYQESVSTLPYCFKLDLSVSDVKDLFTALVTLDRDPEAEQFSGYAHSSFVTKIMCLRPEPEDALFTSIPTDEHRGAEIQDIFNDFQLSHASHTRNSTESETQMERQPQRMRKICIKSQAAELGHELINSIKREE
jgi:hypothetical protein